MHYVLGKVYCIFQLQFLLLVLLPTPLRFLQLHHLPLKNGYYVSVSTEHDRVYTSSGSKNGFVESGIFVADESDHHALLTRIEDLYTYLRRMEYV